MIFSLVAIILSSVSDPELTSGIRKGDRDAFKALFDRYHGRLYHYLLRRGVSAAAAEDILQSTFLAVWERRARLDPERSLKSYLYRTCHNRAANHFRDRAKFDESDNPEPGLSPRQEADLAHAELQDALNMAISKLPERRRAVFELCFLSGLSYREAAEALEISVKTVENQMGHALRAIRTHLQGVLET